MDNIFGEVISSYSRKDALNDGVLIDVTEIAKEETFTIPLALTSRVWRNYVEMPTEIQEEGIQSEKARLCDILTMLRLAIFTPGNMEKSKVLFELYVRNKKGEEAESITLKALVHPDDDFQPVITIMHPNED